MGRIEHAEEIFVTPESRRCTFCGDAADGYWCGEEMVKACSSCAVNVLPKLIADTVGLPPAGQRTNAHCAALGILDHVRGVFWEAMSCRLARAADRAAKPAEPVFTLRRRHSGQ